MPTQTLSQNALSVIDRYLHLRVGRASCSVPYFNNKTVRARGALDIFVGKGHPKEIADEVNTIVFKHHIDTETITDEALKKLLVDRNIGIDCSGFAYHVLNAESRERHRGELKKHMAFTRALGLVGRLIARFRPVKNVDVATLADNDNSLLVPTGEVRPGDMIAMIQGTDDDERNHILIVDRVEYRDSVPTLVGYCHAAAYPEDGVYGSGIKQGTIEVTDVNGPIWKQSWKEGGSAEGAANILRRAAASRTSLRRLKWL